ncbi:MAG: hypothetical protein B7Y35_15725 [Sphingomonadales bacterium 28-64-96]|nr:MAG: hypothetical protein B7Y35_15725 [Sphingomonadales bacterium 28-64-96]
MKTVISYLACPYGHPDLGVRLERFEAANLAAANLIQEGRIVFSPISMTHPIDLVMAAEGENMGTDYWVKFDEAFMELCSEMIVLAIPGWQESKGVTREIEFFRQHGKRVLLMQSTSESYESLVDLVYVQDGA